MINVAQLNEIKIPVGDLYLKGNLYLPEMARSVIIFSHGSGSSSLSVRNQKVAGFLQALGLGTLLFDLLTELEDRNYQKRFDIDLLTERLVTTTRWLESLPEISGCTLGYFGASTGAASALHASSILPSIKAVVSRGGRPDLAADALASVTAPTLLIVGSRDEHVLQLNWEAYEILRCIKKVEIVPGATHLFEEAGALDQVCQMAGSWFEKYL